MDKLYYDVARPGSLSGIRNLARYSKNSERKVRQFLVGQPAYSLHRPVRRNFVRRKTFSKGIGDLYQADIVDLSSLANSNDGNKFLLTCIDVFSKFGFAVPLRTKGANEVKNAFEKEIIATRSCRMLQTDKGTEFVNGTFQTMLRANGIHWYTSENEDIKCAVVERFNRTLKERIFRYLTYRNSNRYVDVIADIVNSYNNTWHRSIGMSPTEVNYDNQQLVADRLYPPKPAKFNWKLQVGDNVRLSIAKVVFRKGYMGSWTEEIFRVVDRMKTDPVTYHVADLNGEVIKGRFYEPELQKVEKPKDEFYRVEKILKTRKRGGKVEYFVKWVGYPDSFNSWTDAVRKL